MKCPGTIGAVAALGILGLGGMAALGSDAEMYFSSDKNGQHRVTNIQEGDSIFIVVADDDENTDCDVRDKIWTDIKIMDPKTGAYIHWVSYVDATGSPAGREYGDAGYVPHKGHSPGASAGWLGADYLEESDADSGVFVSSRPFQIGAREDYKVEHKNTHVVGVESSPPEDFIWGNYLYCDIEQEDVPPKLTPGVRGDMQRWVGASERQSPLAYDIGIIGVPFAAYEMPSDLETERREEPNKWLVGRFENMDTLVGMYVDPSDMGDVAIAMMKIIDVEATISWNREIYKDANGSATVTVDDADENLNCNEVEYVPVFILVNPGSWNPAGTPQTPSLQTHDSPNNFCMLKRTGGVIATDPNPVTNVDDYRPIRWFNIYNAEKNDFAMSGAQDGRYYVQYPKLGVDDIAIHKQLFDTASADGITAVSFYAQETGTNTGVFQLNLSSILDDLGFNDLNVRDVLVAYYLDPNDEDDFKLAVAYIEERQHSVVSFTDAGRGEQDLYWIGRDGVYVQVVDANANIDPCCPETMIVHLCDPHEEDDGEFWVLDELSSNSPVFFSHAGMEIFPTWDPLGMGVANLIGGYQLVLDNWDLEVFNEDEIYVRYNDVQYMSGDNGYAGLGDSNTMTAYSGPRIDQVRVGNDVSFDLASIGDTQVYDGQTTQMWFLDRQGRRVSEYVNSDCVFVEVYDRDQDEDSYRRERVDAFWDGGQNFPFGPLPLNEFACDFQPVQAHPVNVLLGDTNIFNNSPDPYADIDDGAAKIYVLSPRNGRWAGIDLLETGVATGDFVSVTCIDLVGVYDCVPTLGVLPGDTVVAVYQDPSNHSDSAWISIRVGVGGGTPPGQESTTSFVDGEGDEVSAYTETDLVYVKVVDSSHVGEPEIRGALEVGGATYDLFLHYDAQTFAAEGTFLTAGLDLDLTAGQTITATYTDPTDPTDTSSDTITIIASELDVVRFYAAPSPFEEDTRFSFEGTGIASVMSVTVYDMAGNAVWSQELASVTEIVWDGTTGAPCRPVANGGYIYVITATDGTNTFNGKDTVFISR